MLSAADTAAPDEEEQEQPPAPLHRLIARLAVDGQWYHGFLRR
jgi:hypothetical protein